MFPWGFVYKLATAKYGPRRPRIQRTAASERVQVGTETEVESDDVISRRTIGRVRRSAGVQRATFDARRAGLDSGGRTGLPRPPASGCI